MSNIPSSATDAQYKVTLCGCARWCDVLLVFFRVLCVKVVSATSSEGFLVRIRGLPIDFLTSGDGHNVRGIAEQTHFANVPS